MEHNPACPCNVCSSRRAKEATQPRPVKNNRGSVADLVIRDVEQRKEFGRRKYGTWLQAFNGRDALKDAYEESLDQTIYLRQLLEERGLLDQPVGCIRRFIRQHRHFRF